VSVEGTGDRGKGRGPNLDNKVKPIAYVTGTKLES